MVAVEKIVTQIPKKRGQGPLKEAWRPGGGFQKAERGDKSHQCEEGIR